MARYDFSSYRTLVDVGGGSGGVALAITEAHPHIRATVIELPTVVPVMQQFDIFDHGRAHTEHEHRDWLAASGFEDVERVPLPQGMSIIRARKPA